MTQASASRNVNAVSGDAFFDPAAHEAARGFNELCRDILVYVSPALFLRMAEALKSGVDSDKAARVEGMMAAGQAFPDFPFLCVRSMADGTLQVTGHEGRHRAMALQAAGVTHMPLLLKSADIRWGRQHDAIYKYDYIEPWPVRMRGEEGDVIALNLPRDIYFRRDPVVIEDRPLPRQQAVVDADAGMAP